ncbi:unnamed protein product [Durusdinium trenchii]|uniref:Uncharacterized protein n=1 Tax=Durusdinium trenchii TaxID=1381693 RepID=A0ABP0SWD1_9DINO
MGVLRCLPVTGHFYFMKSHRQQISEMIAQAVRDADDAGVKYFGLAHLNKAQQTLKRVAASSWRPQDPDCAWQHLDSCRCLAGTATIYPA